MLQAACCLAVSRLLELRPALYLQRLIGDGVRNSSQASIAIHKRILQALLIHNEPELIANAFTAIYWISADYRKYSKTPFMTVTQSPTA